MGKECFALKEKKATKEEISHRITPTKRVVFVGRTQKSTGKTGRRLEKERKERD